MLCCVKIPTQFEQKIRLQQEQNHVAREKTFHVSMMAEEVIC